MSSKNKRRQDRPTPVVPEPSKGLAFPVIAVAVAVVAGAGIFIASRSPEPASPDTTGATTQASDAPAAAAPDAPPPNGAEAAAVSETPFTPEGPNDLPMPPLPYAAQMSGSPEEVRQAYVFAARNPGLLSYVPCFCGCENDGHTSNADCFVASRDSNGAVKEWDTHGLTCSICLAVARDSMQMQALGASVADIGGAVRTKYASYPSSTPTPAVPR